MDRIDHPTAIDIGEGRRGFRGRDALGGLTGTRVTADWLNDLQEELVGLVEKSGLVPSAENRRQLLEAVRIQRINYAVAGGTANALTATLDPPLLAYPNGFPLRIRTNAPNTLPVTLNVDGLGALPVRQAAGVDLQSGDLQPGLVDVVHDNGVFWLTNPRPRLYPLHRIYQPNTAAVVLTKAEAGYFCYDRGPGTGLVTYTMPNPADFGVGYLGFLLNSGGTTITINANGGGFQFSSNPNITTLTLTKFKSFVVFLCDGANWTLLSSDPDVNATLAQNTGSSLLWQRLDGGSLLQRRSFVATLNANSKSVVPFSTTFKDTDYLVIPVNSNPAANPNLVLSVERGSAGSFTLSTSPASPGSTIQIDYIAWGRAP